MATSVVDAQSWNIQCREEHFCIRIATPLRLTQDTQAAANSSTNRVHPCFTATRRKKSGRETKMPPGNMGGLLFKGE
jgi:hypothetical protein